MATRTKIRQRKTPLHRNSSSLHLLMCISMNTSQQKVCDRNFLTREALILYTEQLAREGVANEEREFFNDDE